jgi:RNA polymerase sigma-70 factor (ECF subfamily)
MSAKRKLIGWAVAGLFVVGAVAAVTGGDKPPTPVAEKVAAKADKPDGGDKKVSDAPPVVVKTVPAAGDEAVDPGLKEVSVTFSKAMSDKGYTWATDTGRGADLPSGDNKATFSKDKKTCSLPVKLEPETTYAVWINVDKFNNFKDAAGNSSLPYLLVFRTGKAK